MASAAGDLPVMGFSSSQTGFPPAKLCTCTGISGAPAPDTVQHKQIVQVLLTEIKHPVTGLQKIRWLHDVPILLSI